MATKNAMIENATRIFSALTIFLELPLSRYMKNNPENRLMTTSNSSSTSTYFMFFSAFNRYPQNYRGKCLSHVLGDKACIPFPRLP
jgi:hypothetical protein